MNSLFYEWPCDLLTPLSSVTLLLLAYQFIIFLVIYLLFWDIYETGVFYVTELDWRLFKPRPILLMLFLSWSSVFSFRSIFWLSYLYLMLTPFFLDIFFRTLTTLWRRPFWNIVDFWRRLLSWLGPRPYLFYFIYFLFVISFLPPWSLLWRLLRHWPFYKRCV